MLIEHLKAEDINLRVTAMRSLPAIADALGPDRVRAELVPFVNDSTDDEDEVSSRTCCLDVVYGPPVRALCSSYLCMCSVSLRDEPCGDPPRLVSHRLSQGSISVGFELNNSFGSFPLLDRCNV